MIEPRQLKMAKAALGLTAQQVADLSGVGYATVARFETEGAGKPSTIEKIQTALETAGVIFVPENGEGAGVRLRKGEG